MSLTLLMSTTMLTKTISPMSICITLLLLSTISTAMIYKSTASSWLALITILTFSSGMMTLFMYTTSMTSNETNKTKKTKMIILLILVSILMTKTQKMKPMTSMKKFSNMMTMIMMTVILIIILMTISTHGHHPNQTITSSF